MLSCRVPCHHVLSDLGLFLWFETRPSLPGLRIPEERPSAFVFVVVFVIVIVFVNSCRFVAITDLVLFASRPI